jgi:hypothetical protein
LQDQKTTSNILTPEKEFKLLSMAALDLQSNVAVSGECWHTSAGNAQQAIIAAKYAMIQRWMFRWRKKGLSR